MGVLGDAGAVPLVLHEPLRSLGHANWHEADAPVDELVQEADGAVGECDGGDDAVEGGGFWPAGGAVADAVVDAAEAERFEAGLGVLGKVLADVDGVDGGCQLSEQGGLVAGASADLEHAAVGGGF